MSMYAMIYLKHGRNTLPGELDPQGEGVLYGHALAEAWEEISQLAKAIGATSLHTFYYDDSETDYDPEVYEQAGIKAPDIKDWHDPREGLKTVTALLDFFQRPDRESISPAKLPLTDCDDIVWDLNAYRVIFECAVRDHQPFRIEIY